MGHLVVWTPEDLTLVDFDAQKHKNLQFLTIRLFSHLRYI